MKAFITSTCLSFMLLLAMTSCTNASLEESMIPVEKDSFQSLLIERGTTPITAEQAINVAKIFDLQNGQSETKASSTQYSDVYTHTNEQGDPVDILLSVLLAIISRYWHMLKKDTSMRAMLTKTCMLGPKYKELILKKQKTEA